MRIRNFFLAPTLFLTALFSPLAVSRADSPATTQPALRPFTAFAWTPSHQTLTHVVPMVWLTPTSSAPIVARAARQLPPDERVLLLFQLPTIIWNNPADRLTGANGQMFQSPWIDAGAARTTQWFDKFWNDFHFAGGSVAFLAQDNELGLSMWAAPQPHIDAIAADPRWQKIAAQFDAKDVTHAADQKFWPQGAKYNDAVRSIIVGQLRRAVLNPLHRVFPDAGTSEFADFILPPKLLSMSPDAFGWQQPVSEPLIGTHQSPAFYAQVQLLAAHGRNDETNPDFSASPMPTLCWETNVARACTIGCKHPCIPWLAAKSWKESNLANSPYYDEMVRHVLLCAQASNVLFWNVTNSLQLADDNQTLDSLLAEMAGMLQGESSWNCITLDRILLNSQTLISGVRTADGRRVFRITLAPGKSTATITLPGESQPTSITLEPGEVGAWIVR